MEVRKRCTDLKSEGYRGMDHEENSGQNSGSITADLNTHDQGPGGSNPQDPPVDPTLSHDTTSGSTSTSRTRLWTKTVPELEERSQHLRDEAATKQECANCNNPLTGNQVYYCSEECKLEFYQAHPTSVRWIDLRSEALKRDENRCVKCGNPGEEVDHVREIWEGGSEFELDTPNFFLPGELRSYPRGPEDLQL